MTIGTWIAPIINMIVRIGYTGSAISGIVVRSADKPSKFIVVRCPWLDLAQIIDVLALERAPVTRPNHTSGTWNPSLTNTCCQSSPASPATAKRSRQSVLAKVTACSNFFKLPLDIFIAAM